MSVSAGPRGHQAAEGLHSDSESSHAAALGPAGQRREETEGEAQNINKGRRERGVR